MTTVAEIKQILAWAIARTRKLLPLSSNFPDPKHQLTHRALYLELARHRSSNPNTKAMINELYSWHLDLTPETERYPLNDSQLWLNSHNKFMHFKSILGEVKSLPSLSSKYKDKDELLLLEAMISKALKFGIGNCDETTALAEMFLLEYPEAGLPGLPKNIDRISVENVKLNLDFPNDHVFLIVNRNSETTLNDITTWNDGVVICDPWSEEVYTKEEFIKKMDSETASFMVEKFKTLTSNVLCQGKYYIGEQHNERIHTEHWQQKSNTKFWHPAKVLDLEERPTFTESLPKMQRENKPLKMSGQYQLELMENSSQVSDYFELFGGSKHIFTMPTISLDGLPTFLKQIQDCLDIKSPPYEFPVALNMSDGQGEICLVYYKGDWAYLDGKDKVIFNQKDVGDLLQRVRGMFEKAEIKITVSGAAKDRNRAQSLLAILQEDALSHTTKKQTL